MNFEIVHFTRYSSRTLACAETLEEAKVVANMHAELIRCGANDGLGQSQRILEHPLPCECPYQILIETMTAEAGNVLDGIGVITKC